MTYLIRNNGDDGDLDSHGILLKVPFLEFKSAAETEEKRAKKLAEKSPSRLFMTHMQFRFLERQVLEDKVKVIVVLRNPKDTLVSYYRFYQMTTSLGNFPGTWDEFFELYKEKRTVFDDVFDHHVGWWKVRDEDNVLVVRYEEMKEDLAGVIRKVAKFTGYELSDDIVQKIVHLTSFKQMKDNPKVNK